VSACAGSLLTLLYPPLCKSEDSKEQTPLNQVIVDLDLRTKTFSYVSHVDLRNKFHGAQVEKISDFFLVAGIIFGHKVLHPK